MNKLAEKAIIPSRRVNWYVERMCVGLLVLLVLDVWLGVLARYVLPFQLSLQKSLAHGPA